MSAEKCRENLERIHMTIVLKPELIEELTKEVVGKVGEAGLKAFPRADGYAFMKNEIVGVLGLPHLRYAVVEDKAMVWVRAPYKLSEELLAMAGFKVEEYCREIIESAKKLAEAFEKYKSKALGLLIELP